MIQFNPFIQISSSADSVHLNVDAELCAYSSKDGRKVMSYLFRFAALGQ